MCPALFVMIRGEDRAGSAFLLWHITIKYFRGSMLLDIRTLVILSAIIPLGMGGLMTVYLFQRKVYPGFERWVISNFIFSLGYFLISLRDIAPNFIAIILSNSLMVYCEILVFEGIQRFFGKRAFDLLNYLLLAVYILAQSYFTYIVPNINARIILVSLVMSILIFRAGMAMLQSPIPQLAKNTRSAALIFLATAVIPFSRAIYTLFQDDPINLLDDALSAWFSVGIVTAATIWNFHYVFLTSARLEMELSQSHEEISQRANTDYLTKLHNRQYFMERSLVEFERCKREKQTFAILFIDLDNLKRINDQLGHAAGDKAVQHTAQILKKETRPYDLAARFGGDEFVMLIYNVNMEQAAQIAERIRFTTEQTSKTTGEHALPIRLSLGVATLTPQDTNLDQLLHRADEAMYQAKKNGRNRIAVS